MKVDLKYVNEMTAFAQSHGFEITSTVNGKHNTGSLHPIGLAVDCRTRTKTTKQGDAFLMAGKEAGYKMLDERVRPAGQKKWDGQHIHMQIADRSIVDYARALAKAGKDIVYKAAAAVVNNPGTSTGVIAFFFSQFY